MIIYSRTSSPGSAFQKKIFLPSSKVARAAPPGINFSTFAIYILYQNYVIIIIWQMKN